MTTERVESFNTLTKQANQHVGQKSWELNSFWRQLGESRETTFVVCELGYCRAERCKVLPSVWTALIERSARGSGRFLYTAEEMCAALLPSFMCSQRLLQAGGVLQCNSCLVFILSLWFVWKSPFFVDVRSRKISFCISTDSDWIVKPPSPKNK